MIVASLLLIAGATGLLVLGLWQSSSPLLSGSIAASLLAAVVLVVGTRRASRAAQESEAELAEMDADLDREPELAEAIEAEPVGAAREPVHAGATAGRSESLEGRDTGGGAPTVAIPSQGSLPQETEPATEDELEPADEPPAQQVSSADAARVSRMLTEVLVVDGRPRYHLSGCVHLLGRESEPLPVAEAVELGFTPCGLCEPDSALLAEAGRI